MNSKVIIVEGLIGAGKSSLTKELAQTLGSDTLYLMEPDEKDGANPYLSDFYGNQRRWAFTMQTHLLQARFRMHLQAQWHAINNQGHALLDRSYFGDTAFARLQVKTGAMTENEFETYKGIYHAMTASVLLPSVCVRLQVAPEVAAERIRRRMELQTGRKCEDVIDLGYLRDLDREINHMVNVLNSQGVQIVHVPWDTDRITPEERVDAVKEIAAQIMEIPSKDLFLDLHRRTL